jgi:beta-phosphoglucomutase
MTEIKVVIFDLDGVLTNTSEYHYRAWKRLADELGIPFDRQRNELLRGVPRRRSLELILDGRLATEEQMQEWMARKNSYYVEFIQQATPADILPGALELLEELRQSRIKIGIGSASKNTRTVLDRLHLWASSARSLRLTSSSTVLDNLASIPARPSSSRTPRRVCRRRWRVASGRWDWGPRSGSARPTLYSPAWRASHCGPSSTRWSRLPQFDDHRRNPGLADC